jgi:hypothetical protein
MELLTTVRLCHTPTPAQRLGKLFNSTVSGLTDGKQLTDDKNIEPCSLIRRFQIIALKDIQLNLTGHSINGQNLPR